MTKELARVYALVAAIVVFFVAWAAVAAHPWQPRAAVDPRVAAVAARQQRIERQSLLVKRVVDRRWAIYQAALASRKAAIARVQAASTRTAAAATVHALPAPSVRVVTLPPLVVTRTS